MTNADLPRAVELTQAVGWPHREDDWRFILEVGSGIVAEIDGAVAGTAVWSTFSPTVSRISMVIVDPARQKAGIGKALMAAVLEAANVATIMLNATHAGIDLYKRLGFVEVGDSSEIMQYQGIVQSSGTPATAPDTIRAATKADAREIAALDADAAGVDRSAMLEVLSARAQAVVLERHGKIAGVAFCRKFGRGHLVGPVIAAVDTDARALIAHWISVHAGSFLRIDCPVGVDLGDWLGARGMLPIAPAFTMVRGPALPAPKTWRTFSLVNQALG